MPGSRAPFLAGFEPGEAWLWNIETEEYPEGPKLGRAADPVSQPMPGPKGEVPADWQLHLDGPAQSGGAGRRGSVTPPEQARRLTSQPARTAPARYAFS